MLAGRGRKPYSNRVEVHVTPEMARQLKDPAATGGRATSVRKTLGSRYDDLPTARVQPIRGEEVFGALLEKSERRRG